jgi:uncharacterized protein (TIGR02453 family)
MKSVQIKKTTLQFLRDLSANNNREWFNTHKEYYQSAQNNVIDFVDGLIAEMNTHDVLENESGKKSIYRIFNDVRFHKNKPPYNPHFAFSLIRATKFRRGGYYVNIIPGNTYLECAFFGPNPEDLKRIRQDIDRNYTDWNKILGLNEIRKNFLPMSGKKVASAPRGFPKDHPAIELLRHKQFIFRHDFTDEEVLSENFQKQVSRIFKSARPWLDYMSDMLTTNLNGEIIV